MPTAEQDDKRDLCMNDKPKRKWGAKRTILTVLGILLLLILLVVACAMIYLNHMLNKINRVDPELEYTLSSSAADDLIQGDPGLVTMAPGNTETHPKLEDIIFPPSILGPDDSFNLGAAAPGPGIDLSDIYGAHLVNILLVGQDRREGQGRQRSDSMILVSVNKSNNTVTLTSFMRDQYVQIPGYKPNKLNAAYAFGGMQLLTKTLKLNFGVEIDGIVEVDFGGFESIIDLLGGVDVTLTEAEAKYLNDLYEAKLLDSPVVVGKNHLNAKQALVYVGIREIDTDYARARRQRTVILGLIDAYKDLPLDQMLGLLDEILPLVTTNLTNSQILSYAIDCFPMLASANVQTLRIPVEGTFIGGLVEVRPGYYGWYQHSIDFEANRDVLFEIFRRRE